MSWLTPGLGTPPTSSQTKLFGSSIGTMHPRLGSMRIGNPKDVEIRKAAETNGAIKKHRF